jgi:hypothetical protein
MKFILSLLLLLCSFGATAQTTIYYNRCDAGAHANCPTITGSDANPGTSPSAPKLTLPNDTQLNALAAGSIVRICNGASYVDGNAPGWAFQNSAATRTGRITVEGYDCGNSVPACVAKTSDEGCPLLQFSSGTGIGIVVGGFCQDPSPCPAPDTGGYVLRGLNITKSGSDSRTGISLGNSARWVLFENLRITGWANGIEVITTQNVRNFTLLDSYLGFNCQNGLLGNASDFTVKRNHFDSNNPAAVGCGAFTLQHGSYVGGVGEQIRGVWSQNLYTNNSLTGGICGSGNATFRGNVDQLTFEENTIIAPGGNSQCIGFSVQDGYGVDPECMRRVIARGNKISDTGSSAMLFRITPGLLAENNETFAFNTTTPHTGINIANPGSAQDQILCSAGNTTVRNNSGYYAAGTSGQFVSVNAGAGHSVFNNLAVIASGSSANCWAHAGATFTLWNYNWCYEQGSGQWSATYANLAAAQAAGFDANGGNTDPLLAATPTSSSYSMALQSSSPLRSAGRNTNKAFRDILWCQRDSTPDIGAHEYGGAPCLTFRAPVELR